jgi:acetylornithine/succinyldiaminopimelate/putrescine aminotransferase
MPRKKPRTSGSLRIRRADSAYLARGTEPEEFRLTRAKGSYVYDARGRKYLDFVMGWCVGNLGWNPEEIRQRVRDYDGPDYVQPSYLYAPWTELASLLADITPGKLRKSFRATGGTEAVEIALQVALAYTGRPGFIAIEDAYHGNSIATVSLTSPSKKETLKNLLPRCHRIKPPLNEEAAERVEKVLKRGDIAALIMEPIICNLGVLIPEDGFMREIARLCRRHGTLVIMDEVACGFGRTGRLFASEHYGLEPDILCLAKAITSGVAPMGVTLTTEKIAKAVEGKVSFYSTYGWHPLSVEAAIATLRYFRRHERSLLTNVEERSRDFATRLAQMEFPSPAKIRVRGLAIGIEFEDEDYAESLADRCRDAGLLISGDEDTVTLFPALTVSEETVHQGLDILEQCM